MIVALLDHLLNKTSQPVLSSYLISVWRLLQFYLVFQHYFDINRTADKLWSDRETSSLLLLLVLCSVDLSSIIEKFKQKLTSRDVGNFLRNKIKLAVAEKTDIVCLPFILQVKLDIKITRLFFKSFIIWYLQRRADYLQACSKYIVSQLRIYSTEFSETVIKVHLYWWRIYEAVLVLHVIPISDQF